MGCTGQPEAGVSQALPTGSWGHRLCWPALDKDTEVREQEAVEQGVKHLQLFPPCGHLAGGAQELKEAASNRSRPSEDLAWVTSAPCWGSSHGSW